MCLRVDRVNTFKKNETFGSVIQIARIRLELFTETYDKKDGKNFQRNSIVRQKSNFLDDSVNVNCASCL